MIFNNQTMKKVIIVLLLVIPRLCIGDYVPGEVLARLKRGVVELPQGRAEGTLESIKGNPSLRNFLFNAGLIKIGKVFRNFELKDTLRVSEDGETVKIQDLSLVFKLSFNPTANVMLLIDSLKKYNDVIYAEPNLIGVLHFNPNDDSFPEQWGLKQGTDCDIDADLAWDIEKGNYDIKIGIVDIGVDWYHKDLGNGLGNGYKVRGGYRYDLGGEPDPRPWNADDDHVAFTEMAIIRSGAQLLGLDIVFKRA